MKNSTLHGDMSCLKPDMFDLVSRPEGVAAVKEMTGTRNGLKGQLLTDDGSIAGARRNFIGVLEFYLEGPQNALESFQEVLDTDPDNINAIQNCIFVYRKMNKDSDVEQFETRLRDLLLDEGTNKAKHATARCHAERGYVMSFEFTFDRSSNVIDFDKFQKATDHFEKALPSNASDVFSVEESCQWHFFAARAYHRLYNRYLVVTTQLTEEGRDKVLIRTIGLLDYVLKKSESDTYRSKAWCLLGSLMFKMPQDNKGNLIPTQLLTSCITKCGLDSEYENPALCFQAALKLYPKNPKFVYSYARMFLGRRFCDLPRAIELLSKSIEMNDSQVNWLAFSSRGQAYERLYERQKSKYKSSAGNPVSEKSSELPDRNLLLEAKKDFETSLTYSPNQFKNLLELASVCHLLGKPKTYGEQPEDQKMMDKALCHFSRAVDSLEGRRYSYLHYKRALCLRDCGEVRGAIECYKTAMKCKETRSGNPSLCAFKQFMMLLLQTCRDENLSQHLIGEAAFWFDYGFKKSREKITFTIEQCCRYRAREMLAVCTELREKQYNAVARLTLATFISTLKESLEHYKTTGKDDKIPDAEMMLKKAEVMSNLLSTVKGNQSDGVKPVKPTQMSKLSLSNDGEVQGSALAAAAKNPEIDQQKTEEDDADFRKSIAHALEIPRNTKEKSYDFFALYSDEDIGLVRYDLVPMLEYWYKFKGFIRARDLLFGEREHTVIGSVIEDAICSIAVLSNNFLEDRWPREYLDWAFNETVEKKGEHSVVLVRLPDCNIPDNVTRMSKFPVIEFHDSYELVTLLQKLGECVS